MFLKLRRIKVTRNNFAEYVGDIGVNIMMLQTVEKYRHKGANVTLVGLSSGREIWVEETPQQIDEVCVKKLRGQMPVTPWSPHRVVARQPEQIEAGDVIDQANQIVDEQNKQTEEEFNSMFESIPAE
jgi:hypothetical protein